LYYCVFFLFIVQARYSPVPLENLFLLSFYPSSFLFSAHVLFIFLKRLIFLFAGSSNPTAFVNVNLSNSTSSNSTSYSVSSLAPTYSTSADGNYFSNSNLVPTYASSDTTLADENLEDTYNVTSSSADSTCEFNLVPAYSALANCPTPAHLLNSSRFIFSFFTIVIITSTVVNLEISRIFEEIEMILMGFPRGPGEAGSRNWGGGGGGGYSLLRIGREFKLTPWSTF
jgi:hypothetical protein